MITVPGQHIVFSGLWQINQIYDVERQRVVDGQKYFL